MWPVVISQPATTAHRPATEPTERSNSPATSRMVWPTPMIPTYATAASIARILMDERNPWFRM